VTGFTPAREGANWRCPAHDDRTPSLSVTNGDGKVALHCHAGCGHDDVVVALGLVTADLFDAPIEGRATGLQIATTYDYTDEAGALLFQVLRLSPKGFRQRRPDGSGGWVWNLGDTRRPLYRLPEVLAAVADERRVFVVEGEKDAEAVRRAGEVATTNPGGAGKWRAEYGEALHGAEVVVVVDRDQPGLAHGRQVAAALRGIAYSVDIVEPAEGKDVADHLAAGRTLEELLIVEEAGEMTTAEAVAPVDPVAPVEPTNDLFRIWTTKELLAADRSFVWLARGLLTRPTYGMVGGPKKTLKSYVDMFINLGVASGVPIFGQFVVDKATPVLTYVGEGGRIPYTRRLERVAKAMGVDLDDIPLFQSYDVAPILSDRFKESLARDLAALEPGLVSLDPFYAFHGGATSASDLHEEGALLTSMSAPCMGAGASLMVVNHFNKTGNGRGLDRITQAGGQEWCDTWVLLSHRENPDVPHGHFRLLVEIGSRQWGGSEWDLDLDLGTFDVDLGEFIGDISWDLRRHVSQPSDDDDDARALGLVASNPGQLTKEDIAKGIGGNRAGARAVVNGLEARGAIVPKLTTRVRSDGKPHQVWAYWLNQPTSDLGQDETSAGPEW